MPRARLHSVLPQVAAIAAGLLIGSSPGSAQRRDSLSVAVGRTVRVILMERPLVKFVGPLAGSDSLRVFVNDRNVMSTVGIEWMAIESIEVRRPHPTSHEAFARGARIGAIVFGSIGAAATVAGVVWDLNGGCSRSHEEYCIPRSFIIIPAYLLTVGGTVLSSATGLVVRDRWHTVWRNR